MTPPEEHDFDTVADEGAESENEATAVAAPAARRRSSRQIPAPSIHSVNTQQLPAARTLQSEITGDTGISRHTTASTPAEAMLGEEIERTRIFLKIALGIIVFVVMALPFMGGDPLAKRIVYGGISLAAMTALWALWKMRDEQGYSVGMIVPVALALAMCSYAGVYYFGVFSPAPALILLGIYFFSLGSSPTATLAVYVVCASLQGIMSVLIASDLVIDRGLIRADALSLQEQFVTQAIVQVLFLSAYIIGRSSRKTTLDAIAQLERAVRSVSQRDALLLEAKQDLDRALRVGGPGRYSDQRVGSFKLGVLIGRGGMGEVYEGRHMESNRLAAIKLLHPHVLANPDHVTRFVRETEVAQSLRVANVVDVIEVGRTEGQVPFLAMERLSGRDLAHHLRSKRRLSMAKVLALVRQVATGLEAARKAGIVHRDIKPQNLFLAEMRGSKPVWKILDFGVSKLADHSGTLTKGHVVGTPGYMAPEQARGEDVDHRADVYALAAISYRALTGRPAFSGKDLPSTLYDVVYKMPARPTKLVETLSSDIDLVLAIGMAKSASDRFSATIEFADALTRAAKSELPEILRARARAILAVSPWGSKR